MRPHLAWVLPLILVCSLAEADNKGFQISRYEPTPAGEWSFMVDHPWYSSTRWFAGGITLDYGHDPLVYGERVNGKFSELYPIIEHQLVGHIDVAGSFLDRVTIHATLPITFYEGGRSANGISPLSGAGVGDMRLGAMVRIWGQPEKDPISVHAGLAVWIPFGLKNHQGDDGARVMPKVVLAGYSHRIRWSADLAFYYRPEASIGTDPPAAGTKMGSELQLGAAVAYADHVRAFSVGPELLLSTVVVGGSPFGTSYTSLELLLGAHYHILRQVLAGLAVGTAFLREPGTPDARVILRIAYAPERKLDKDTDHDGILDSKDRCPNDPEDKDGFEDQDGCPDPDNDKDGILDVNDSCPNEPEDKDGFQDSDGCPDPDNDKDGILDKDDKCPNEPEDKDGFEDSDGCPDPDNDKDGVLDTDDKCPNDPGPKENLGCPDKDRDGDGVIDRLDNCPDVPGDPANQGCKKKQLARIENGRIAIVDSVYFESDKDVIIRRSFPLLENVADVIKGHPEIQRVLVEGHTDSRGKLEHNMDLSQRRAQSVVTFLVEHGVEAARLSARGFGPTQPISDNRTQGGRARNRRVVFTIIGAGADIQNREQGPNGDATNQEK